jgi:hypothetical protein
VTSHLARRPWSNCKRKTEDRERRRIARWLLASASEISLGTPRSPYPVTSAVAPTRRARARSAPRSPSLTRNWPRSSAIVAPLTVLRHRRTSRPHVTDGRTSLPAARLPPTDARPLRAEHRSPRGNHPSTPPAYRPKCRNSRTPPGDADQIGARHQAPSTRRRAPGRRTEGPRP